MVFFVDFGKQLIRGLPDLWKSLGKTVRLGIRGYITIEVWNRAMPAFNQHVSGLPASDAAEGYGLFIAAMLAFTIVAMLADI